MGNEGRSADVPENKRWHWGSVRIYGDINGLNIPKDEIVIKILDKYLSFREVEAVFVMCGRFG